MFTYYKNSNKQEIKNHSKRKRCHIKIENSHVIISLSKNTLVIQIFTLDPPSSIIQRVSLNQLPQDFSVIFNSLNHFFNFLAQTPQNITLLDESNLHIAIQVWKMKKTFELKLSPSVVSVEQINKRIVIVLQSQTEKILIEQRRFRMKTDEKIRLLEEKIETNKQSVEIEKQKKSSLSKDIDEKTHQISNFSQFLAKVNIELEEKRLKQTFIVSID